MSNLGPIAKVRRLGSEKFHAGGSPIADADVLEFWRWSFSTLASNATRGVLAEYIVGKALSCREDVREEWAAYDLTTPGGISVEVKSAAYIQCWRQERLSSIRFDVRTTAAWSETEATYASDSKRQALVYVFAILAHQDQETLDPLDLDQWVFYVVPTAVLNDSVPTQREISLARLLRLNPERATYTTLPDAVQRAADMGAHEPDLDQTST